MHLNRFLVGQVYDVGTSLGSYLLAMGAAEPLTDDSAPVVQLPEKGSESTVTQPRAAETRRRPVFPRAVAADTRARKKKR